LTRQPSHWDLPGANHKPSESRGRSPGLFDFTSGHHF
jgi:hypothetical protein